MSQIEIIKQVAKITDLETNSHAHSNKTYLDKISEDSNGKPIYNGDSIGGDATSIDGITIDDSTRSNGRVLTYNNTKNNLEYADVTVSGIVGSSKITTLENVTIASGSEVIFNHPTSVNIVPVIEEQIGDSNITDTHVDFSDSNKYVLQDSNKLLFESNKVKFNNYTRLLLHMDGTNGSTTFTDSSPNNSPVTIVGSTLINTSQSKFGGSSGYFPPSSYAKVNTGTSILNAGTGDFTMDFWVYPTVSGSSTQILANNTVWSAGTIVIHNDNNQISIWAYDYSTSTALLSSSTTTPLNTWTYVKIYRQSGTIKLQINSSINTTVNYSGNINWAYAGDIYIGEYVASGTTYIDEFRVLIGKADTTTILPTTSYSNIGIIPNTPLYLQTTGTSDYSLTSIDTITSLTIPVVTTANSTVKCLFSVDNKTNWFYYDGTSIQKFTGDITQDWGTTSSSYTQLQTYFTNKTISSLTSDLSSLGITSITTLDLMFQLNTTNLNETPSISPITMVYNTLPHNEFASIGTYSDSSNYGVKRISNSQLSVKNKSLVSKIIKLNVITSV